MSVFLGCLFFRLKIKNKKSGLKLGHPLPAFLYQIRFCKFPTAKPTKTQENIKASGM